MNKKWNKLSEKLPKINKEVFILREGFNKIYRAKLKVFLSNDNSITFDKPKGIEEGDLFWMIPSYPKETKLYGFTKSYPYWTECKDLLKIITNKDTKDNSNRFDLLDIRENG